MTEINVVSEGSFAEAVRNADGPVLALFTAPTWCIPCQRFEPHWVKAQETEALEGYTFVKVDMGATPEDTGQHWASNRYNVLGVPTLKLFGGGRLDDPSDVKARAVVPLIRELTA